MNKKVSGGLSAKALRVRPPLKWNLPDAIVRLLLAVVISVGAVFSLFSGFDITGINIQLLVALSVAACALAVIPYGMRYGMFVTLALLLAIGAYCLLTISAITDGVRILANQTIHFISEKSGRIIFAYEVAGDASLIQAALIPVAMLISLAVGVFVNRGSRWFLLAGFLVISIGCAVGFLQTGVFFVILLFSILVTFARSFQSRIEMQGHWKTIIGTAISAAVFCAALFCAGYLIFGDSAAWQNGVKADIMRGVHDMRYHEGDEPMSEGDINNAGPWNKTKTPQLEITADTWEKLYLKGFVGEVYTGTSWDDLPGDTVYNEADMFYWIHRDGFFGQSQLSSVAKQVPGDFEANTLTVKNVGACKKWMYVPYAVYEDTLDVMALGDAGSKAQADEYNLTYTQGGLSDWYSAQADLSELIGSGNEVVQAYLNNEAAYRDYVYENYLQITENVGKTLTLQLGADNEARTLGDIKKLIIDYLDENIRYDESAAAQPGNGDFIKYFLEQTKRGYSIHYATTAVMMLRLYGVPARYVEGYHVPAATAEQILPGETLIMDGEYAHAWAEYYLDGVGWIAFEVTPGYIDEEELSMLPGSGSENRSEPDSDSATDDSKVYSLNNTYIRQSMPELKQEFPSELPDNRRLAKIPFLWLWILLILLILVCILLLILKRRRFKRQLLRLGPGREGMSLMFGYCALLMSKAGVELGGLGADESAEKIKAWNESGNLDYKMLCELNREALFSDHEMSAGQYEDMKAFVADTLTACKAKWNPWQKVYYRWINCVYE